MNGTVQFPPLKRDVLRGILETSLMTRITLGTRAFDTRFAKVILQQAQLEIWQLGLESLYLEPPDIQGYRVTILIDWKEKIEGVMNERGVLDLRLMEHIGKDALIKFTPPQP